MKKKDLRCCGNCMGYNIHGFIVKDNQWVYTGYCFDRKTSVKANGLCSLWEYDQDNKEDRTYVETND